MTNWLIGAGICTSDSLRSHQIGKGHWYTSYPLLKIFCNVSMQIHDMAPVNLISPSFCFDILGRVMFCWLSMAPWPAKFAPLEQFLKRTILRTLHACSTKGISRQTRGLSELPRGVGKRLAARWGDKVCLLAKAMKARLRWQKISGNRKQNSYSIVLYYII